MEDDLKKKGRRPKKDLKILIPLKFRGKPFLGLAQLSKIFLFLFSVVPMEAMSEEQLATEKPRDHRPKKWIRNYSTKMITKERENSEAEQRGICV